MGKKNKRTYGFEEEFKALGKMAPGIKALLSMTRDIAEGYRKYRKKGGEAIPALEKHLALKECECAPAPAPEAAPDPEPLQAAATVSKKAMAKKPAKKKPAKAPAPEEKTAETDESIGEAPEITPDTPRD